MSLLGLLFLLQALCLLSGVTSQDIFVSNSFSSDTCTVALRDCPDISSALAISSNNDTIYINPGIYNGSKNANICTVPCMGIEGVTLTGLGLPSEIIIYNYGTTFADTIALYIYQNTITTVANMSFVGFENIVTNEPNKVGAIEVVDSQVLFKNVIFANNSGVMGGALHAKNSNVTFNSTHFERNFATLHGGAVMLVNSNAVVQGCTFLNNSVSTEPADLAGTGGAIYFLGVNDLTIADSKFLNNGAEISGGAVFMDLNSNSGVKTGLGRFSVRTSVFRGNSINGQGSCVSSGNCNSRGGALFVNAVSANVVGCDFEGNSVQTTSTSQAAQGGALYFTTNALDILVPTVGAYVYNCTFLSNHATGQGGAMFVIGQRLDLLLSVFRGNYVNTVNSYFTDSASQGGALYYSSGNLGAVLSNVLDCDFVGNSAYSGWGGAIFGTDSVGTVYVQRSTFSGNYAYSSYTNTGHGGALMVASNFNLNLYDCTFTNNTALPYLQLMPLTYSGSGGAIFAQTTGVNITKCHFTDNEALTGQFDSGSAGGAIMLEDCYPASITHCEFQNNGAAGYFGYSSFASPGTGGAIYVKFSAAKMSHNKFRRNWVSAGGNEASIGGAVAVFFEYSSVSSSSEGVSITHSEFSDNVAYGELCTVPNQAGQGGGLAVVGASVPAVYVSHVNFTNNVAFTASKKSSSYLKGESLSLGGALSIALSSNITVFKSTFRTNLAYNGAGNDFSSISGQTDQENFVHATDSTFIAGSKVSQTVLVQQASQTSMAICSTIKALQVQAKQMVAVSSSESIHHAHAATADYVVSSHSNALGESDRSSEALFSVPDAWQTHLLVREEALSGGASDAKAEPASERKAELSLFDQKAAVAKRARWMYLKDRDSSLLLLPGARRRVQFITNQILRLDLWKQQQAESTEGIRVDEAFAAAPTAQSRTAHTEFTVYGRRASSGKPGKRVAGAKSLVELEQVYRENLYAELGAEFERLERERRNLKKPGAPASAAGSGIAPEETTTFTPPDSPSDALTNFHPYVVITSGRAYFENPTFEGVYHMFFGDFPEIAQYTYDDSYILNAIVAVPSYSAIFGHITQEDLILTAITASIEIFDSNDNQNYTISQVNLFNSTLQLNRNVTVSGGSFVTGSLITSVDKDTTSLIPYVAGGDSHPFVTFTDALYTGVSLKSVIAALGSVKDRTGGSSNSTEQTVVTINSCTLVIDGAFVSDSPTESHGTFDLVDFPTRLESSARIFLNANATIHISPRGKMVLLAETYIDAQTVNTPAVVNEGQLELFGRTKIANYSFSGRFDVAPFSQAASLGSLTSRLVVHGTFVQTAGGSITLYMNRTQQHSPAIYLISSANFSGSVYVDFYVSSPDGIFPDLQLYGGVTPSSFSLIAFRDRFSDDSVLAFEELSLHPQSSGLLFAQTTEEVGVMMPTNSAEDARALSSSANATSMYAWGLEIENIGCPQINDYYIGVPQQDLLQAQAPNAYACYVCLQNTSCNLCNGVNGAAAGVCAVAGTCGSAGVAYGDSCCDGGCNGQYGTCEVNAEHTSFSCDCSKTIWYTGPNCKELSPEAYVVIFSCVSFVITIGLMAFFYHRSLQQKRIVLDELADGLLNHQTEGVNSEYIQYMQQALILNDVFVKWEEITLESVVGEGSFGVVHKATFRGAQVAVKQMRSMFTELTDKEIDEFRKEAYVMSRLRHPNIVLVMGISLVDQEPVAPPKSRSQNMSADMYDSSYPGLADAKKAKPQKTVCIITEFLEQGSLADILYGPTKLPAEIWTYELVLTCALQAARGMLYLHSHQPPICHRDLKSSNLVVDDHWVVKVTDFGMSRIVPENVQDRDKGILSPINSTSSTSSVHPLGPRKFSMGNSPAGRKFSLGWPSQASSSLQSTPVITSAAAAAEAKRKAKVEDPDLDPEYAGERASIATVDSIQDSHPSLGDNSIGNSSQGVRKSAFSKGAGASRLSTLNPEMTSNLGTTAWCAPEVLVSGMKTRYTVKVDVYSFGLVLWELWEKKRPFEELTSRFDIMDAVRAGKRPEISANCPPSFRSLIQRCWQSEPSRRPMFKYIVRYLKDELARVKRQKGGAMYNPATMRPSEADVEPRRSGSNFSGVAGGTIAEAAEAAAEFFRKSFSFRGSFAGTSAQQAASPTSNHRPWASGAGGRDDPYIPSDSAHSALAALSAAARRNEDGTLRMSDGSASASGRPSAAGSTATGTGTGTGSAGTGRVSEMSGGVRPSDAVPVRVPEGRSPLVTAVTSERSLSYLTESPAPFSHMQAINRQPNRGALASPAGLQTPSGPIPTPATKNINNRWRDRYVLNFSGWAPTKPDSGLPPSMASPNVHSSPAAPGFGGGLPPTRSVTSTAQPQEQPPFSPAPPAATGDISYNPMNRSSVRAAGNSTTTLSRTNSNASNPSSAASSPKPAASVLDRAMGGASAAKEDEMFVLDEDEERKL